MCMHSWQPRWAWLLNWRHWHRQIISVTISNCLLWYVYYLPHPFMCSMCNMHTIFILKLLWAFSCWETNKMLQYVAQLISFYRNEAATFVFIISHRLTTCCNLANWRMRAHTHRFTCVYNAAHIIIKSDLNYWMRKNRLWTWTRSKTCCRQINVVSIGDLNSLLQRHYTRQNTYLANIKCHKGLFALK